MPPLIIAPSYPHISVEPYRVVLEYKPSGKICSWEVDPGSMFVRQYHWYSPDPAMVHIYNFFTSLKAVMADMVSDDLSLREEQVDGGWIPRGVRRKVKENAGRFACKQTKSFFTHIVQQASDRAIEDSSLMFSVLGRGHRVETQEYLDSLDENRREHVWNYGARMTMAYMDVKVGEHWTDVYAPWHRDEEFQWYKGELTRTQRRVLYQMPGRIFPATAQNVSWAKEEINFRIPSERMVWVLISVASQKRRDMDWSVIQRSSMYNIRKALRMVRDHRRYPDLATNSNLESVCGYIADIGPRPRQTVFDWARDAIAWHEDAELRAEQQRLERERRMAKEQELIEKARCPRLKKKLPRGFTYLTTREQFEEEGTKMQHCVAGYWIDAKLGQYFIFHYEDRDGEATVQLGPDGKVRQSYGVRNAYNETTRRAQTKLEKWATGDWFYQEDVTDAGRNYYTLPF